MGPKLYFLAILGTGMFARIVYAQGQSDADLLAEGKYALDHAKDCKAARDALYRVSERGRRGQWYFYAASAHECLGDYGDAVALYSKYRSIYPQRSDITDKIGELNYRLKQQQLAAEKQAKEKADSMARVRSGEDLRGYWEGVSGELAGARVRIVQTGQSVKGYLETNPSGWDLPRGDLLLEGTSWTSTLVGHLLVRYPDRARKLCRDPRLISREPEELPDTREISVEWKVTENGMMLEGGKEDWYKACGWIFELGRSNFSLRRIE